MQHRRGKSSAQAFLLTMAGLSPLAAQAEDSFWYLGGEAGINFAEKQKFDIYNFGLGVQDGSKISEAKFDTGWLGGLTAGYGFANGLRPELEFSYRSNNFKSLNREPVLLLFTGGESDIGGKETALSGMANLWYDLRFGEHWRPYLGAGIGYTQLKVDSSHWDNVDLKSDKDWVLAWQAGAGVAFDFDEHWTTSIDYRYFDTQRAKFDVLVNAPDTRIKADYAANTIMLGLSYRFPVKSGESKPAEPAAPLQVVETIEPPPPPPPSCEAPSPGEPISLDGCKTGESLVLHGVNFEFDEARLTANAKAILVQVADELRRRRDIKVEIDGHTDARGDDSYNQRLSDARAESVRQFLIGRGIAPDRMTSKGFGESMPIADNSSDEGREKNRRVELKVTASNGPADSGAAAAAEAAPAETAPAAVAPEPAAAPAELAPTPAPVATEPGLAGPAEAPPSTEVPVEALPAPAAAPAPTVEPLPAPASAPAPAAEGTDPFGNSAAAPAKPKAKASAEPAPSEPAAVGGGADPFGAQ